MWRREAACCCVALATACAAPARALGGAGGAGGPAIPCCAPRSAPARPGRRSPRCRRDMPRRSPRCRRAGRGRTWSSGPRPSPPGSHRDRRSAADCPPARQLQVAAADTAEHPQAEAPATALQGGHARAAYAAERALAWWIPQRAYPCRMNKVKVCGMTNLADAEHAASHGAWAIGLIHHPESPRYVRPEVAEEIGAALKRRCEIAGVFVNSTARRGDRGRRAGEPDAPPAPRRGGAVVLRRGAAAHRRQGDQGDARDQRRRRPGRRGLPDRLPPLRRLLARDPRRDRRELRLGPGREAPLEGADDPRRRADAPRTSPRRSSWSDPSRSTSPAASRPSRVARTTPRSRRSSRQPGVRAALAGGLADEHRSRGALRPLRRPLRPRDPDRGARRAQRRLGGGARGRGLPDRARRAAARLRRPPDAALSRRAALGAGRRAAST